MEKVNLAKKLALINEQIRKLINKKGVEKVESEPIILHCYLANYFNYNVIKGGFAQLLYNLRGNYLKEIEDMLSQTHAKMALESYLKAVSTCLENIDDYQEFINGNYEDANKTKDSLHLISIEYFDKKIDFENEIEAFINQNYSQIIDLITNKN